jgi:L-amino acid N-acyltransferase YncA
MDIRPARPEDAAAIAAIYNEGIEERQATFETQPRSEEHVLPDIGGPLPFLVAAEGDRVLGWAKVGTYSTRPCYEGVGEASIYIARAARRGGVGRRLLEALAEAAERQGHWKLIGLIFPENAASVALFELLGYERVGLHRRHGRLDGEWRDVLVLERRLGDAAG